MFTLYQSTPSPPISRVRIIILPTKGILAVQVPSSQALRSRQKSYQVHIIADDKRKEVNIVTQCHTRTLFVPVLHLNT